MNQQIYLKNLGPATAAAVLVWMASPLGFVTHLCNLRCTVLEVAVTLIPLIVFPIWAARASSTRGSIIRAILAFVLTFVLSQIYHASLHSSYFPDSWYDAAGKPAIENAQDGVR